MEGKYIQRSVRQNKHAMKSKGIVSDAVDAIVNKCMIIRPA